MKILDHIPSLTFANSHISRKETLFAFCAFFCNAYLNALKFVAFFYINYITGSWDKFDLEIFLFSSAEISNSG